MMYMVIAFCGDTVKAYEFKDKSEADQYMEKLEDNNFRGVLLYGNIQVLKGTDE